ncbi:cytochrome P450 [Streptomyces sp. NRRL S-1868]|uniref:cytochrome P450 n=1 Tax=Streptomyces sp. NRRL S-1868 TaxID=1463892 RepID=UPI000AF46E59|nr:cytochrome P450 [Streptomyces sp. NRRL S-1868]
MTEAVRETSAETAFRRAVAPGAVPLVGHVGALWRRPLGFLASLPAHGDILELRLGPRRAYVVCHPELIRKMLLSPRTFDRGGLFDKAKQLLGNSLSTTAWEEHRRQRLLIQPSFRPGRIAAYTSTVAEDAREAVASWSEGQLLDLSDAMHGLLMRVAAGTLFSSSMEDRAIEEARECLRVASRGIYRRTISPFGFLEKLPTAGNRRYRHSIARLRGIVAEVVASRAATGGGGEDLLDALLEAQGDDPAEQLTEQEIHDQVVTFLVAGSETTASALAFTFYLLATHPEIEERVHAEVGRVLDGELAAFEHLSELRYTSDVVTEALRLYPPSWMATRVTTEDTALGGQDLRKGSLVLYSPYAVHRNPALFREPDAFRPERWSADRKEEIPRNAMIPFGAGSHKCIGDVLALTEAVLVVATVVARWRLTAVAGSVLRPQPRATLEPGPVVLRCERRA